MATLREALVAAQTALDTRDEAQTVLNTARDSKDAAQADLDAKLGELHRLLSDAARPTA